MFKKRRRRGAIINLDSLTDILANTVGIVIFLMIFAVLTTRGSFIAKKFPMLYPAGEKERVNVYCHNGKLMVFNSFILTDEFLEPLDRWSKYSSSTRYNRIPRIVDHFNETKLEDGYFELSGDAEYTQWSETFMSTNRRFDKLELVFQPVPGFQGDTIDVLLDSKDDPDLVLETSSSHFCQSLASLNKDEKFLMFFVDTNSVNLFRAAREVARKAGFSTNWSPSQRIFWPIRINLLSKSSSNADDVGLGGIQFGG